MHGMKDDRGIRQRAAPTMLCSILVLDKIVLLKGNRREKNDNVTLLQRETSQKVIWLTY